MKNMYFFMMTAYVNQVNNYRKIFLLDSMHFLIKYRLTNKKYIFPPILIWRIFAVNKYLKISSSNTCTVTWDTYLVCNSCV